MFLFLLTKQTTSTKCQKTIIGNFYMIMLSKTCQKLLPKLEASINLEAKSISTMLEIRDRVKRIARTPSFVTLKDQKDNFHSSPTCLLINPSKSELGKVSK